MITRDQIDQFVKQTVRTLKGRRREQAAFAITALCFTAGFMLSGKLVPEFKEGSKWIAWLAIGLYAVGAIFLVYGVARVWRLVQPPELPPGTDRPSAIKGPMAFTEADGDLFRKLGRESELQKLLGLMLDDQVLMVVVRGASGAGKTSLLRAGLKHILGERVTFHYWEAVPTEPDKGLLRALQEKWPEGATKPASLDELVNPVDALGRQSHVIVLDQFEQLRGSRKIFQLLRRIVREARPPHRITWVIAFRREFSADWMDFISPEQERGFRPPQDVSLRLFTAEQAREVIGQLVNESNLKDSIEQSVINNLVEAATVEGEVSPVDIGIGLLVLAELHERQSNQTITIRDYQFAGGAEGLLTQYISRCLEFFPKENQEAILKAMLALRDAETNQRLAEGLTAEELATEAGAEARLLKPQLDRLSHRDARLLETVTPPDGAPMRYRLPHERLIPALYRLTGKLLAEVDQAKLKFQNAFHAWKTNDKRRHYLLKAKELRLVERYETQIPWGSDEQEKKGFLFQSKRHHHFIRALAAGAGLALITLGVASAIQYRRYENKRYLRESGYPPELYDHQYQLKNLELTEPLDLDRFTWLSSDSIEELSLKAANSSNSIAGLSSLSRCQSLKNLTIDLSNSQVRSLEPLAKLSSLTQLTLDLRRVPVSNLEPLARLNKLTRLTLTLGLSEANNLEPLAQLRNLSQLTLTLGLSGVHNLEPLAKLSNLTQLTLNLSSSRISSLEPLLRLSNRTQLMLNLGPIPESNLELLSQMTQLTHLTLELIPAPRSNLEPLAKLSDVTHLTLSLGYSQAHNLEPLTKLSKLTHLTLSLGLSSLEPLAKLSNLTHLTLNIVDGKASDLEPLSRLSKLTELSLNLGDGDLQPLAKLSNLTRLTLRLAGGQTNNLEPLSQLSNLTQLTLTLDGGQASDLKLLAQLSKLTNLTLELTNSRVSRLEPLAKLSNLRQLTLNLAISQTSNLEPLVKLNDQTQLALELSLFSGESNLEPLTRIGNPTHLTLVMGNGPKGNLEPLARLNTRTQLSLELRGSEVIELGPLAALTQLQTIFIREATRAQRMSLQKIPAHLVELKF